MKSYKICLVLGISIVVAGNSGCIYSELDNPTEGSTNEAIRIANGLPVNGLPVNGLPVNGLPHAGLPDSRLPGEALPNNGLCTVEVDDAWDAWLNDPTITEDTTNGDLHNRLMTYMVRCALSDGQSASYRDSQGHLYQWSGEVGLAPNWLNEGLNSSEKRWITSCVLSLVNADGTSVIVSQRGPSSSDYVMVADEADDYPVAEGAFFGDMFADPPVYYACNDPDLSWELVPGRRCTLSECSPMNLLPAHCHSNGAGRANCSIETRVHNAISYDVYYNCRSDAGETFEEVTTVYLPW